MPFRAGWTEQSDVHAALGPLLDLAMTSWATTLFGSVGARTEAHLMLKVFVWACAVNGYASNTASNRFPRARAVFSLLPLLCHLANDLINFTAAAASAHSHRRRSAGQMPLSQGPAHQHLDRIPQPGFLERLDGLADPAWWWSTALKGYDLRLVFRNGGNEFHGRHIDTQVDHLGPAALEHHPNQVLADVVQVALDRADDHLRQALDLGAHQQRLSTSIPACMAWPR